MGQFYLGCAVWAYKPWVGSFYPAGSQAKHFLRLYSERLTAVEGNTTFYSIPDQNTLQRWCQESLETFRFCLKLPRSLTHNGTLVPSVAPAQTFVQQMSALGQNLGPMFAQLPPTYGPQHQTDLETFLQSWPARQPRLALEVRHRHWFLPEVNARLNETLRQLQMARVLLDTRPIYDCDDDPQVMSERRKPKLPLLASCTTDFTIVRFISHPHMAQNQPYLQEWVERVKQWLNEGITVYFFVHCPEEVHSPAIAQQFQALLEAAKAPVPPLPWNQLQPEPSQLSLFG